MEITHCITIHWIMNTWYFQCDVIVADIVVIADLAMLTTEFFDRQKF